MKGPVIFLSGFVAGIVVGPLIRSQMKDVVKTVIREGAEIKQKIREVKDGLKEDVEDLAAEKLDEMS